MQSGIKNLPAWAIVLLLAGLSAPIHARRGDPVDPSGLERLRRDSNGTARVEIHRATGAARFVRLRPGRPHLPGPDPDSRAAEFLRRYGGIFGIRDRASELTPAAERVDRIGGRHLRYLQRHEGLPVFAGELRAHFDPAGRLIAVNGTFVPEIAIDTEPRRTAAAAAAVALAHVRNHRSEISGFPFEVGGSRLLVFRAGLVQGVAGPDHLAWEIEVGNGADVRDFVFVDAHTGKVVDRISGVADAVDRKIHEPQFNNVVIWSEGDPLPYDTGDPDNDDQVNRLIDVSREVYDLYAHLSGGTFLSWDGSGGTLHSVWNIPPAGICPNAYWNGLSTNFCDGVTADDTVAHEWTHAYTDSTHDLIYQWQPGALNEAYSDIFGEVVDLLNGTGTDSPGGTRTTDSCSTYTGPHPPSLEITAPPTIAGSYGAGGAVFNPNTALIVTADVELVDDGSTEGDGGTVNDGCQTPLGFTPGNIALIDRGVCSFATKVLNAQDADAGGVLIVNTSNSIFNMGGTTSAVTIPAGIIRQDDGLLIKAHLATGVTATMTLEPGIAVTVRWLAGEDDPAFGGAIRDMWNPTCYADPGRVLDTGYYVCGDFDYGGVHSNSGIPSHAFALLADGGTFNGRSITAIGLTKAAHIYWRAMRIYQVPASDFADHADAVEQSCADLIGAPLTNLMDGSPWPFLIGPADCDAVAEAMLAVEMRADPSFCNFQPLLDPTPPTVDCGTVLLSDDFETDPVPAWSRSNSGVYPEYVPRDWEWTAAVPTGGTGSAFFGLDSLEIGDCVPGSDDQSGVMHLDSPPMMFTAGVPVLGFDHYVATEADYDGGNLLISVNGSPHLPLVPADFRFNPYNRQLTPANEGNTNPLAGQHAFSGSNQGELQGSWGRSVVDLSMWANPGDTIRVRFSLGVDGCNGLDGWYIDNVQVCLDCSGAGGADADTDGYRICDGDCDDARSAVHPDRPETNDGLDNQCPGEAGRGQVDEITGDAGFHNPASDAEYSWPPQEGATDYQVARATSADFTQDCTIFPTGTPELVDATTPPGGLYFYLVRPLTPFTGSWGVDSGGASRTVPCASP